MIAKISGQLVAKRENSLIIDGGAGLCYEVLVPNALMARLTEHVDEKNRVELITYHYLQISPSSAIPVLVGFFSEMERDFFLQFIKVSGIGPRAAVKALDKPISEIAEAITQGDTGYLKSLPGIGLQRAKEIVAKLQSKVGKYGLIRDRAVAPSKVAVPDWQEEALEILLQLQYKPAEAKVMIEKTLARAGQTISSAEELLNEIYKQRTNG